MQIKRNQLLYAVSTGLEAVEVEFMGVKSNHSKRVAYMATQIGKKFGLSAHELLDLQACCILHDSALTQCISKDFPIENDQLHHIRNPMIVKHCINGENNAELFPFRTNVNDVILYHHENTDGSGYFGKKGSEIPLMSQMIHISDIIDVTFHFNQITPEKIDDARWYIHRNRNRMFDADIVDAMDDLLQCDDIHQMSNDRIEQSLVELVPELPYEMELEQLVEISRLFGFIIDAKSPFTLRHSSEISEKVHIMSKHYEYDHETTCKLRIAAFLHDIGKLTVPNSILEKPGELTNEEFCLVKDHAYHTHKILSAIEGFEQIAYWASSHHERLNGTGYFRGVGAEKIDCYARLIACIDVYQAVVEDRPYRKGMSHEQAVTILNNMAKANQLDQDIVNDVAKVFAVRVSA